MKQIELNGNNGKGKYLVIDDADSQSLEGSRFHLHNCGYVTTYSKKTKRNALLHRLIINPPAGYEVDHINGDKLGNRRENLRLATKSQNMANKSKHLSNKSGFKGVVQKRGIWLAQIGYDSQTHGLGTFRNPLDAARAYDDAAKVHHKEFARVNGA